MGVAEVSIPNAFAFGRSIRDGRICVTRGIQRLLNRGELLTLRSQGVRLKGVDRMMEIFTTHPNRLKRIKRLATLA